MPRQGLGRLLRPTNALRGGNKQKEVAGQTMAYLGEVLADNDFLAGSEFSVADITAFAGL